jgi:3',5'-cyclic-AMP phosphodiesterase
VLKAAVSYSIPEGECINLVQVTDPHLFADPQVTLLGVNTADSLNAVLQQIGCLQSKPHLMLVTGDISQDYSADSYRQFVAAIGPLDLPCHYLPGNHDDPHVMRLHMQGERLFGQKRILAGNWQILMLDSTVRGRPGGYMSDAEMQLIDAAVAAEPERHLLLVMHHNPILVESRWLDQHWMVNGEQFLAHVSRYPQVKGVLWGHVHQQLDLDYGGRQAPLRLMATPSTCIQFKPKSADFALDVLQPGYRLLGLHPDGSMQTQVYRVTGICFSPDHQASGY